MQETLAGVLSTIQGATRTLTQIPVPDDALVDCVGMVRRIETQLADYRRALTAEIVGPFEGSDYRAEVNRKATRSYNTNGILAAVPLPDLVEADAVRLQWRWTQLKNLFHHRGLELRKAPREIDDGDPQYLVGETWSESTRVVTIPADEQGGGF